MLALADAAAQPVIQRDQDGERRQMAGAVIAGRPAGPRRLPGATEPRLHAGHRLSISRLSIARARARERQVFRARAESPNARRRDKRADRPFAKIKELFTKIMRLS